jgi:hypothetical protein
MKKLFTLFICFVFLGAASATDNGNKNRPEVPSIFEFNRLTPVVPPFTGAANPIRGIGGGGAPWKITSGKAELNANGELEVSVRGLVLVGTGANPIANFAIILSCQSKDAVGAPTVVNLSRGPRQPQPLATPTLKARLRRLLPVSRPSSLWRSQPPPILLDGWQQAGSNPFRPISYGCHTHGAAANV